MIEDARRIEAAADDLKARLARLVEDGPDPGTDQVEATQRGDGDGHNPYRAGDGKFAPGPHAEHDKAAQHTRAVAALADPEFRRAHAQRLAHADAEARSNFPREPHGEEANHAVARWQHAEAMRIHAEHDAIGGNALRDEIAQIARTGPIGADLSLVARHERAMKVLAEDHAAGLEERRAALAGHIKDVPHAKHDAFLATREQVKQDIAGTHEALDKAHGEASAALDRLRAVDVSGGEAEMGGHKGWESKLEDVGISGLNEHYEATSMHLAEAAGGHAREFGSHEHHEVPFPQREEHSTEHDYNNALAAHENTFKQRAWLAQSALERLHEQQRVAVKAVKDAERKHDKAHAASMREIERVDEHGLVNQKAFSRYERDSHGEIRDEIGADHLQRAEAASDRRVSNASWERENARMGSLEDAKVSLHDEATVTRDAIRELSKITGRAPKLGKP